MALSDADMIEFDEVPGVIGAADGAPRRVFVGRFGGRIVCRFELRTVAESDETPRMELVDVAVLGPLRAGVGHAVLGQAMLVARRCGATLVTPTGPLSQSV